MTAGDIALIATSAIGLLGLIAAIWMFKDIPAERRHPVRLDRGSAGNKSGLEGYGRMDTEKRTVKISVSSRDEIGEHAGRAAAGELQGAHITFPSMELLWKLISPKKLDILQALAGSERVPIREVRLYHKISKFGEF